MDPWYKIVTPRKEVREGRSFNPDEFAIALEQVVAGTAPDDYKKPELFFARTCFTRALREHAGMVLRRLSGITENSAPVMALITQFGGGKTHTLTSLYHLAKNGKKAADYPGVGDLLKQADLSVVPEAKVAVFVGNAWDPQEGCETPWIDVARQLAGEKGVEALGKAAKSTPPGTESLGRVFQAAGGSVLILFDEVLNFLNRHRPLADSFHAFIQNLTVAMTGTSRGAAVISLPRSQVEMTESDMQWQEKITKVVRRVAKDLMVNDEAEISEVIRRRLFEDLGSDRVRKSVARTYADWCFERRAQLPSEWTAVDTAATETKAREFLLGRFEACYPFHPATLSVFQRKWQALPQYQQTRGTLAMFAQWISWAFRESHLKARREPLITLGSAPLEVSEFKSVVLGQLGEARLAAAIDTDIAGIHSHARALDADSKGVLRDIHRRVATTILFESSGGQKERIAHFPEMRFALGEPDLDTTSLDNAAVALESKAFFIRRIGADGFQIRYQPTLKKVVSDRRASLDESGEVVPAMRRLVEQEFRANSSLPILPYPEDGASVHDPAKLTLILMGPEHEWVGSGGLRENIAEWTKQRGKSPRLYPGSLIWCLKKPGRELREKVELWLAWRRVQSEVTDGTLGADFERGDRLEIQGKVKEAEEDAKDEVWASYRYAILADGQERDGLRAIDIGAGHASGHETLCGRIIAALKTNNLLNDGIGAGYMDRNWPEALKQSGAWPLASLRQSFLNGALTRLLDPDAIIKGKVVEFVSQGDFGLASGQNPEGAYQRVWFEELVSPDEVTFESGVFLLKKSKAKSIKKGEGNKTEPEFVLGGDVKQEPKSASRSSSEISMPDKSGPQKLTLRVAGNIPPELWNRLGTKILPKLKAGENLQVGVEFTVTVDPSLAASMEADLAQILDDLGLSGRIRIERKT